MKTTLLLIFTLIFSGVSIAQDWVVQTIPTSLSRFDDVFFLNENLGWAADGKGYKVYKTTDGGENWNLQLNTDHEYLRNIAFLDEDRGFLGTLTPNMYRTLDGGVTWDTIKVPGVQAICGLAVIGSNTVYGCGAYFEPAYLIKTSDGGDTWSFKDMSAYATSLVEVLFVDENIGFASGGNDNGGVIIKTTDGGVTWTEVYNTGLPGEVVWKMQQLFSNPDAFFCSVQSVEPNPGKLIKSLDGGQNWTKHDINPTNSFLPESSIQGVGFVTENHGWASGHSSLLLETLDGGETWLEMMGLYIGNVNRFHVLNQNLVYAAGYKIYKFTDVLSVSEIDLKEPNPLDISINPNPLNDELNIKILFDSKNHMVITLFDEQGRKLKQLSRETIIEPGEKSYVFDFPYASGVYYVHFHSDVNARSIKVVKM